MLLSRRNDLILLILAVAAFTASVWLSSFIEKNRITVPESYADEDLDLQGRRLKGYALGFEGLLADWYWMRSLQYVGDKIVKSPADTINLDNLNALNPRLLYPLLDNATDLDPKFTTAYSYGAVVLPAIDPKQAIALAEKGIANNPDDWQLYQYLGYTHWKLKDYSTAAQVYDRGSRVAGAPPFLKMMAGLMETRGGSRDTARSIYQQMYHELKDEDMRAVAELRLKWLDSLDERDFLNNALSLSEEKSGRCAASLSDIYPLLRSMPHPDGVNLHIDRNGELVDPTGVPYVLEAEKCEVQINPQSRIPKD